MSHLNEQPPAPVQILDLTWSELTYRSRMFDDYCEDQPRAAVASCIFHFSQKCDLMIDLSSSGVRLNGVFRFAFRFVFRFVVAGLGGPGGGFGGFILSSRSGGFATTATTNGKAAKTTTRNTNNKKNKTKNKTKNEKTLFR